MKKNLQFQLIILIGFLPITLFGQNLVRQKAQPIISARLEQKIAQQPGSTQKIWIYFTDKGFSSQPKFEQALQQVRENLPERTLIRRRKVKENSGLVHFQDIPVDTNYISAVLAIDGVIRKRTVSRWFNAATVEATPRAIRRIANLPFVRSIKYVERGVLREPKISDNLQRPSGNSVNRVTPGLNYGASYTQLERINVIAAHQAGYTGAGVLVLMLDTGCNTDHIAFPADRIVAQYDFIQQDSIVKNQVGDASGQDNHGTATASVVGAAVDGSFYGPAYQCDYLLAKTEILDQEIQIEEDYYAAGLEWGESLGADLASSSLGYIDWYDFDDMDGQTAVTTQAVNMAIADGMVVITAAGNENRSDWNHIISPADARWAVSCGAVDYNSTIASFSSHGPTADGRIKPEVSAPGDSVVCANSYSNTGFTTKSGTSLSTPLVAGVAALIIQAHPDWSPHTVREALMMTASQATSPDNIYGWGVIDALAAINYVPGSVAGDVNQDGLINVSDIVTILDDVIPNNSSISPEQIHAADMNRDGLVNTTDVDSLTNYLLDQNSTPVIPVNR